MNITYWFYFYSTVSYICFRPLFSFTHTIIIPLPLSITFYGLGHVFRLYNSNTILPESLPNWKTFTGSPLPTEYNPDLLLLHWKHIPCFLPFFLPNNYPIYSLTRMRLPCGPHIKYVVPASMSLHMLFPLHRIPSSLCLWSPTFLRNSAQMPSFSTGPDQMQTRWKSCLPALSF